MPRSLLDSPAWEPKANHWYLLQSDGESGDEGGGGGGFEAPDGEIIHPDFDDIEIPSGSDDDRPTFDSAPKKKQRTARFEEEDAPTPAPKVDLEALALQALARR